MGRGHLAVPGLGQGVTIHTVLGHQPKLSLQRCPLTESPEAPVQGPNFMTASTGRNQGVRGALWSLIPADCRSCGHHKPRSYYLPWAQGWVAQRIDSEEQSLLHICQLKSCPRQWGSNMHPRVFCAAAVLYPGAPAAGKHFLLHLPHLVPACSAPQGGWARRSSFIIRPRDSSGMALAACPQRYYFYSALLMAWQRCSPHLH